ncbi:MAG: type II secretion system minor pseudopilin GspK [Agarilytica sp.]
MSSQAQLLSRIAKPKSQQGVALILAMMIVTLIAIVATEISWRFELSTSRSGNRWAGIQARAYIEGAEQLAMIVLREDQDNADTQKADHQGEDWAQPTQFPTDHGAIEGVIEDAQGRFNMNMMVQASGACPNDGARDNSGNCKPSGSACDDYTDAQRVFIRLLQTFNIGLDGEALYLNQQQAQEITEAVIDWLDEDSNRRGFGGVESEYYDQLEPPVAIKNGEMASVSELLLIKGMLPQLYNQLADYVIALPTAEVSKINLNNAKEPVLRALRAEEKQNDLVSNCDLSPIAMSENSDSQNQDVETGVDAEAGAGGSGLENFIRSNEFYDWQDLVSNPDLPYDWTQGGQGFGLNTELFEIAQSKYFILESTVLIGEDYVRKGKSLIKREGGDQQGQGQNPGQGAAQQGDIELKVIRRTDANF